jgi:hypothetical protein
VASFSGVGVLVTTIGVTQLGGVGVAVLPTPRAWAVTVATIAAAVSTFSGVGVLVWSLRRT